jgi:hypothetical protein
MTARVWTKEKLDEVWPVKGWTWGHISGRVWALYCDVEPGQYVCMSVLGRLCLPDKAIPPTAALTAIIGVHEGRDSMETMTADLERGSQSARSFALLDSLSRRAEGDDLDGALREAYEEGMREAAEMFRRGMVKS